jgi:hypothetical protein
VFAKAMDQARLFIQTVDEHLYEDTRAFATACWREMPKWVAAIQDGFEARFKHRAFVRSVQLALNEFSHRQGGTSVIMHLSVPKDEDFSIRVEFLLEHPWGEVSIAKRPRNADPSLEALADQIERLQGRV